MELKDGLELPGLQGAGAGLYSSEQCIQFQIVPRWEREGKMCSPGQRAVMGPWGITYNAKLHVNPLSELPHLLYSCFNNFREIQSYQLKASGFPKTHSQNVFSLFTFTQRRTKYFNKRTFNSLIS